MGLTREQAPKQSRMSFNLTCIHLRYPWQLQEAVAGAEPGGEARLGAGALEEGASRRPEHGWGLRGPG